MRQPHVRHPNRFELALILLMLVTGCGSPSTPTPPDPYPTGPHAVCPPPVSTTSPNGQPLPVAYGTPTAEGGAPPVTLACTPASGTLFPVGTTSVTCTATDAR